MTRDASDVAFDEHWSAVVAHIIARTGRWDLSEDAAQHAFVKAIERWPIDGIPTSPVAWLKTTALNAALDVIRRERRLARRHNELVALHRTRLAETPEDQPAAEDDRLRLVFTCCHPALPVEAQVALALRTLMGLTTAEIAVAFRVSEEAMAKRLVRAKAKIRDAHIPFVIPEPDQWGPRTHAVLNVVLGLFNEGYAASTGSQHVRGDLCHEAIRLARLVTDLMPDEPEAHGLLGLLLLLDARRPARTTSTGEIISLEDQDRSRWNRDDIALGNAALERAMTFEQLGPFQLQAAIAAVHDDARSGDETDWSEIVALYDLLVTVDPAPVVELNRHVAIGMSGQLTRALDGLDTLEAQTDLGEFHRLHVASAELLRRAGRLDEAKQSYRRALAFVISSPERDHIGTRLASIDDRP